MREGDKMQITISNYNNIRNLDYEIEDSKINFLFGISGCGKSSIAKALTKKSSEDDLPGIPAFDTSAFRKRKTE